MPDARFRLVIIVISIFVYKSCVEKWAADFLSKIYWNLTSGIDAHSVHKTSVLKSALPSSPFSSCEHIPTGKKILENAPQKSHPRNVTNAFYDYFLCFLACWPFNCFSTLGTHALHGKANLKFGISLCLRRGVWAEQIGSGIVALNVKRTLWFRWRHSGLLSFK